MCFVTARTFCTVFTSGKKGGKHEIVRSHEIYQILKSFDLKKSYTLVKITRSTKLHDVKSVSDYHLSSLLTYLQK